MDIPTRMSFFLLGFYIIISVEARSQHSAAILCDVSSSDPRCQQQQQKIQLYSTQYSNKDCSRRDEGCLSSQLSQQKQIVPDTKPKANCARDIYDPRCRSLTSTTAAQKQTTKQPYHKQHHISKYPPQQQKTTTKQPNKHSTNSTSVTTSRPITCVQGSKVQKCKPNSNTDQSNQAPLSQYGCYKGSTDPWCKYFEFMFNKKE